MSHHKAKQTGQWLKVLGNTIMGNHSMAELALFSDLFGTSNQNQPIRDEVKEQSNDSCTNVNSVIQPLTFDPRHLCAAGSSCASTMGTNQRAEFCMVQ